MYNIYVKIGILMYQLILNKTYLKGRDLNI